MEKNSKCICFIHPWMAYFGKNQENSCKLYIAKYLKINFKCCYCNTYYKNQLKSTDFIKREDTKKNWNGKLDKNYKYIINLKTLKTLI